MSDWKGNAPACTNRLRELIEIEFTKYGYTSGGGVRSIALAPGFKILSATLGVSEGTVKNAIAALKAQGYILRQESGLYLVLASTVSPSSQGVRAHEPPPEDKEVNPELRRMPLEQVTGIFRDVCLTCDVKTASAYIDAHRRWCWLNGLSPYI